MKRKIFSLFLAGLMTVMCTLPVLANDEVTVIDWGTGSSGTGTVSGNNESTGSMENNTDTAQPGTNVSKPYLALGADLSQQQLATVLSLMGLAGQDLSGYNVVYITNAQEHQYLDQYVSPGVIGTKSLSSVLVRQAEAGHGVQVTTQNINYCTVGMYRNALLTAGVENADIMVVGPSPISGTAALIGALKAYEDMSGQTVTEASLDTALNELVTTGEIAEALGDSEQVSELIAFIKAEIAGKDLDTEEEIEEVVVQASTDYGVTLSEEEINQIVSLMMKIKDLGLDYNKLLDQAQDLYEKFGDKLSLSDLANGLSGETKFEIIKASVGQFFTKIMDGITGFFKGLFGK